MTPGGGNIKRPDRAVIAYANLIRRHFKKTRPIVLGGIEASLRRISHYDYWSDSVRRSILFDAKADILFTEWGNAPLSSSPTAGPGQDFRPVRGICYPSGDKPSGYLELPPHAAVTDDKSRFLEMFRTFYDNADPQTARGLVQKQDTRYLVQNPPQPPLTAERSTDLRTALPAGTSPVLRPRRRRAGAGNDPLLHHHPPGMLRRMQLLRHRRPPGTQGDRRSEASLLREAERLVQHPAFKGVITDVGGPTANMYGFECARKQSQGACSDRRCLFPVACRHLPVDHRRQMGLLRRLRSLPGIKKVFVASGIRYDLLLNDARAGAAYLEQLLDHHVSGQMKIAPEHSEGHVLQRMGKPGLDYLRRFKTRFDAANRKNGRKQYLTYYFLAAHPGCTLTDMSRLKRFVQSELRLRPEQVQIFTPTPSTWAAAMYYTEIDPDTGGKLFVEKNDRQKERQKNCIVAPSKPASWSWTDSMKANYPVTQAVRALRARKIDFSAHLYPYLDHGGARWAAESLQVPEHAVIKTLVMETDTRSPLIVLMHGDCEVSTKQLARTLDAKRISPCETAVAERLTGYQVGGISPLGTRTRLDVYGEASIFKLEKIFINGGKRGFLIEIDPQALKKALACREVNVALAS